MDRCTHQRSPLISLPKPPKNLPKKPSSRMSSSEEHPQSLSSVPEREWRPSRRRLLLPISLEANRPLHTLRARPRWQRSVCSSRIAAMCRLDICSRILCRKDQATAYNLKNHHDGESDCENLRKSFSHKHLFSLPVMPGCKPDN